MSASVVIRSGLIGAAVIAATIGFVNITLGSAIVGATRRVPVEFPHQFRLGQLTCGRILSARLPVSRALGSRRDTRAMRILEARICHRAPASRLLYRPMDAASAAARCMLVDISLVTVLCSSTAAAVDVTYSLTS